MCISPSQSPPSQTPVLPSFFKGNSYFPRCLYALRYMWLYLSLILYILFEAHFPDWASTQKNYRISREYHKCTNWNYVRFFVLLQNLTHWHSVKRSIPPLKFPSSAQPSSKLQLQFITLQFISFLGLYYSFVSTWLLVFYTYGNSMRNKKEYGLWILHKLRLKFQPHNDWLCGLKSYFHLDSIAYLLFDI